MTVIEVTEEEDAEGRVKLEMENPLWLVAGKSRKKKTTHLYNKGKTRNLEDHGIILAEFGSTRRFVDLLRWTH